VAHYITCKADMHLAGEFNTTENTSDLVQFPLAFFSSSLASGSLLVLVSFRTHLCAFPHVSQVFSTSYGVFPTAVYICGDQNKL